MPLPTWSCVQLNSKATASRAVMQSPRLVLSEFAIVSFLAHWKSVNAFDESICPPICKRAIVHGPAEEVEGLLKRAEIVLFVDTLPNLLIPKFVHSSVCAQAFSPWHLTSLPVAEH